MTSLLMSRPLTMLPGAGELLAEVRAAGVPHALVTSSERPIMDAVLRQLGVGFIATVCADDVTRGKPDPEPYLRAASLLGADPRACVALEDSPNGVASAEAAGCRIIAVPSLVPIRARDGRTVAASLSEVNLALLRDLVAAG
jgi:HAD superfamily hydrolase (TIGR01509 family)